jgi:hypothetical protein
LCEKNNRTKESSAFDTFEQQESVLSKVEVNVVFGFIGDIGSEISTDKTMPISVVLTIEFIFQVSGHLLSGMHFLKGIFGCGKDVCLHFWVNISGLDDWLVLLVFLHLSV